jgi:hypothetical protein
MILGAGFDLAVDEGPIRVRHVGKYDRQHDDRADQKEVKTADGRSGCQIVTDGGMMYG